MGMNENIISVNRVEKIFQDAKGEDFYAVKGLNMNIGKNQLVSIVGPNGCGKTTLLEMMSGLEKPSSGEILIKGKPVLGVQPGIGFMFQGDSLFPWRTVAGNVAFGLESLYDKNEAKKRVSKYLRVTGLEKFSGFYPNQLSGGLKQLSALARTLATEPDILFLDEPFSALDPPMKEILEEHMLRIIGNGQNTIVFVTHDIDSSIFMSDMVAVMTARPGRIKSVIDVNLPRPRNRDMIYSSKFEKIREKVWSVLKGEVDKSFRETMYRTNG
jgi:NitT/TauT family transport system ATP-binding protein